LSAPNHGCVEIGAVLVNKGVFRASGKIRVCVVHVSMMRFVGQNMTEHLRSNPSVADFYCFAEKPFHIIIEFTSFQLASGGKAQYIFAISGAGRAPHDLFNSVPGVSILSRIFE
jgi:hypothetical protein